MNSKIKNIITIVTIVLLIIVGVYGNVYAENEITFSANVEFSGNTSATVEDGTVVIYMEIGDITGVDTITAMGFEAKLEFDEKIFSSLSVTGLNNWTAEYNNGKILGNITGGAANQKIVQLTFTIDETAISENTTSTTISFTEGSLVVNQETATFTKEIPITITKTTSSTGNTTDNNTTTNTTQEDNENTANETNTNNTIILNSTNNTATGKTEVTNSDNTTSTTVLPSTGVGTVVIIAIIIIMAGIGFYVKYKSIQTK